MKGERLLVQQQPIGGQEIYLLHLGLVLSSREGRRITFLLQIHLHELVDGQLAGGRVLKLCEPEDTGSGQTSKPRQTQT